MSAESMVALVYQDDKMRTEREPEHIRASHQQRRASGRSCASAMIPEAHVGAGRRIG